jgi:C_GCAxxG_C_C family probable redox protein
VLGGRSQVPGYIENFCSKSYHNDMNKVEVATSLFKQGFNCAQSLLAAYSADFDLKQENALKIASAFGGGIARTGETCGFVTGALMIIGLKYGMSEARDKKAKTQTYETAQKFMEDFKLRNHSVICGDLLGFDISSTKNLTPEMNRFIMSRCQKLIRDSVEILDKILK